MSSKEIVKWLEYFNTVGIRPEVRDAYIEYCKPLLAQDVPVIFEFAHLAALLGRTPQYLASVVNGSCKHYRVFKIPKRRGGFREIHSPYPALLESQRWISNHILIKRKVHKACHGFVRKRSIISNAESHSKCKHLLKMDLKDFFPSITISRVIRVFRQFGYAPNVSFYLAAICCVNGRLAQGAGTSPILSNIIAYTLDKRLSKLAITQKAVYTRYADDLTFSADVISTGLTRKVHRIIESEGFVLNGDKTRLCRGSGRKIVTGLSVSSGRIQVPRAYKTTSPKGRVSCAHEGFYIACTKAQDQGTVLFKLVALTCHKFLYQWL